jgi:hypothetical protein
MGTKQLPPYDQPFTQIIADNYFYSDKTKYIYELVKEPKGTYFLSRPPVSVKPSLLNTLNELFSGNRKRFKGLD